MSNILFEKFISEPKNFEVFIETLWNDMSKEFLLKYNPIEEKNNEPPKIFITTW